MSGFHFDDIIKVVEVDADGKKYDKVSRIDAKSQDGKTDIVLDINSELYPVKKNELYRMVLSQTLALDGSATGSNPEGKLKSLADKFEYVMHGLLYKVAEESSKVVAYISFGGLQLKLSSEPLNMHKFKLDQRLFILLRKM
ncbi:PREDICTED: DNA-directed RNA polymerases II, IV and V subunit 8B-like [Ipomoea nil]|uniref:DNA-directed RNA polymerases II, IV and V subunit 8B-like n=1 Tax=Ipomoea nil TaxID=35883 RepID=UPI000900F9B7|nr:PREDICTED: DNA-directed RNA polymerases II, IV and V subunit 8B-like [Ipomoea nil]XP_019158749.1 PREDICTED: DNA-directed RNA polymerases II, IV and V subunit 8B-like [Ipomoea nil]XP_019158750.1 PREDICTED: DNA-directed RNA polymerases II, IV and V subunit 8B-like [Ipomoea nil]